MIEGMSGYAESATAGLNINPHGGRINPDYGGLMPSASKYCKTEDDKSVGIHPFDGKNKRIYKFHKKTGLGVVVSYDEDGLISINFIG